MKNSSLIKWGCCELDDVSRARGYHVARSCGVGSRRRRVERITREARDHVDVFSGNKT